MTILMVAFVCISLVACGDDESDGPTSGTWKLVQYNGSSCTWGEYMRFSSGKVAWNSRMGGKNVTYSCRVSGTTFYLTNASDGSENITFYIQASSSKEMVTSSSDDITRLWKR